MPLRVTVEDHIATIVLDDPVKRNAFTFEMIDEWEIVLRQFAQDDDVRVIVLTGAGATFSSGIAFDSLESIPSTPLARREMLTKRIHRVAFAVQALDKPLVAAINGSAVGAGLDMALMCDIRFAAESAKLSEGYISIGLVPGDGGCYYLPRLVGTSRALELLWTGDSITAHEAREIGMVDHVVPDAELMNKVYEFAHKLASRSPVALGLIKRAVYQGMRSPDLQMNLDLIASHMGVIASLDDSAEAYAASKGKRRPRFTRR